MQNDNVYENVSEMCDDNVKVTSQDLFHTHQPLASKKSTCNGTHTVPTADYPATEITPGMYDDLIHTSSTYPACGKEATTCTTNVIMGNRDEGDFVITQDNPAYLSTPEIHGDSDYEEPSNPTYLVVSEDSSHNEFNKYLPQKIPPQTKPRNTFNDVICAQPKAAIFDSALMTSDCGSDNRRSIPKKHNHTYAIQ